MPEPLPDLTFDSPPAQVLAADGELWQIYDSSFPSAEREPREVILETLRRGDGVTVRARNGASTIGLAMGHLLRQPPVLFVVYLAVAQHLRFRHVGSALLEEIWTAAQKQYAKRGAMAGMVWEVDIPEIGDDKEEQERGRRRIAFFERLGGHVLPAPYFQPPVDGVSSVPMHLMFRPVRGQSLPEGPALGALVRAMYFEKYHRANGIPETVLFDLLRQTGVEQPRLQPYE